MGPIRCLDCVKKASSMVSGKGFVLKHNPFLIPFIATEKRRYRKRKRSSHEDDALFWSLEAKTMYIL